MDKTGDHISNICKSFSWRNLIVIALLSCALVGQATIVHTIIAIFVSVPINILVMIIEITCGGN